jgi:biopolymer transport protein ExbB
VHFPVLIRLNAGNFNFSEAREGGADLMFAKSDNAALPHEIERWDPAAGLAEVWVRVDTILGNDSNQSITMYWGASGADSTGSLPGPATARSNGAAVFDTADGFQGVWHLGDGAQDSIRDATVNRFHGISPDTARPSIADGAIGNCRKFDGKADYIAMPKTAAGKLDFPQSGKYSVSVWVTADTFTALQQTLVSKSKYQYFLWMDSTSWQFWEFQNRAGWQASAQPAILKQWVLLTGVRDGAVQHLYVDGESVDSISLKSDTSPRNTASDLIIGRAHDAADGSSFRGNIDEIRIESTSRSSDWIRLSYMNQRIDDRLVVNKK